MLVLNGAAYSSFSKVAVSITLGKTFFVASSLRLPFPGFDPAGVGEFAGQDHVEADTSIEESLAPSRRTSCSRAWLASLGSSSGLTS